MSTVRIPYCTLQVPYKYQTSTVLYSTSSVIYRDIFPPVIKKKTKKKDKNSIICGGTGGMRGGGMGLNYEQIKKNYGKKLKKIMRRYSKKKKFCQINKIEEKLKKNLKKISFRPINYFQWLKIKGSIWREWVILF